MVPPEATGRAVWLRGRRAAVLAWGLWGVSSGLVVAGALVAPAAFFEVLSEREVAGAFGVVFATVGLAFTTVGAFLGSRRPGSPIGWLAAAWGLVMSWAVFAASYTLPADAGLRPGAEWVAWVVASVWHPAFALLVFILLLFPDGRLPSPRWRPFAALAVAAYALLALAGAVSPETVELYDPDLRSPLRLPGGEAATAVAAVLLPGQLLLVVAAMAAPVVRLRRARGRERHQITVVVYAVVVAVVVFIGGIAVLGAGYLFPVFSMIPVAVGYAILRHRLYDIDRLVSRTVTYALVVSALVGVYASGVLLVGSLLPRQGELAVVVSTFAVAALFNPLRGRVQAQVDRRFNRARYDAEQAIRRLTMRLRADVGIDELAGEVLDVVDSTVQPTTASVWLQERR